MITRAWLEGIAHTLSKRESITLEIASSGDKGWSSNIKERTVTLSPSVYMLEKEEVLALILHETGHIKHTRNYKAPLWVEKKKCGGQFHDMVNCLEDTRIDRIVSAEYLNAPEIISEMNRQAADDAMTRILHGFFHFEQTSTGLFEEIMRDLHRGAIKRIGIQALVGYYGGSLLLERMQKKIEDKGIRDVVYCCTLPKKKEKDVYVEDTKAIEKADRQLREQVRKEMVASRSLMRDIEKMPVLKSTQEVAGYISSLDYLRPFYVEEKEDKTPPGSVLEERIVRGAGKMDQAIGMDDKMESFHSRFRKFEYDSRIVSRKVAKILRESKYSKMIPRQKSGRIMGNKLFQSRLGQSRLFEKRREKAKDYAVSISVDVSGSMLEVVAPSTSMKGYVVAPEGKDYSVVREGSLASQAFDSLAFLSLVLLRLKIPFQVLSFSTHTDTIIPFGRLTDREKNGLSFEEVKNELAGAFDERFGEVTFDGTMYGKCVKAEEEGFSSRKEAEKINFIISDGALETTSQAVAKLLKESTVKRHFYLLGGVSEKGLKEMIEKALGVVGRDSFTRVKNPRELPDLLVNSIMRILLDTYEGI